MTTLNFEDMVNLGSEITQLWMDDGEVVVTCTDTHNNLCYVVIEKEDRTGAEAARMACRLASQLSQLWNTHAAVLAVHNFPFTDETELLHTHLAKENRP